MDYFILAAACAYFIKGLCGFANTLVFTSILGFSKTNIEISPVELVLSYPSNIILVLKNEKRQSAERKVRSKNSHADADYLRNCFSHQQLVNLSPNHQNYHSQISPYDCCRKTPKSAGQLVCAFCAKNRLLSEFKLLDRFLQIGCHLRQMLAGRSNLFDRSRLFFGGCRDRLRLFGSLAAFCFYSLYSRHDMRGSLRNFNN